VTQVTRSLIGNVPEFDGKRQRIGWAHGDASGAIVALLPEIITHGIQSELADGITLGAVVTGLRDPLDAERTISPKQDIQGAARTQVTAETAPRHQQIE
jgi:hypothetical protein